VHETGVSQLVPIQPASHVPHVYPPAVGVQPLMLCTQGSGLHAVVASIELASLASIELASLASLGLASPASPASLELASLASIELASPASPSSLGLASPASPASFELASPASLELASPASLEPASPASLDLASPELASPASSPPSGLAFDGLLEPQADVRKPSATTKGAAERRGDEKRMILPLYNGATGGLRAPGRARILAATPERAATPRRGTHAHVAFWDDLPRQ
jgi:hypothetical protein